MYGGRNKALIVGGGFGGLYASYILSHEYGYNVVLAHPSSTLGGVMAGTTHNGFALDFGCQVFDNFDRSISNRINALGNNSCEGINLSYGSRINGARSHDMSAPDLSMHSQEDVARFVYETTLASDKPNDDNSDTLLEYFTNRWGPSVTSILSTVTEKIFGICATELDQHTRIYSGLTRIRIAPDEWSLRLKQTSDALDERLAASREAVASLRNSTSQHTSFTNIHPMPHSFQGYCKQAERVLESRGVKILLNTEASDITYEREDCYVTLRNMTDGSTTRELFSPVVWTASFTSLEEALFNTSTITPFLKPMGMHLYYHFMPVDQIADIGYFQNYDQDLDLFRWSSMGCYSRQVNKRGESFTCTEIPDHVERDQQKDQQNHYWREMHSLDLVRGERAVDALHLHAPRCYDLFLKGFTSAYDDVVNTIWSECPELVFLPPQIFGRHATATHLQLELENVLDTRSAP